MREDVEQLALRMLDFAVGIVKFADAYPRTPAGRHISLQVLRSGTSSSANYEEACAAESRADFIHKLTVSLKELRETRFWLRVGKSGDRHEFPGHGSFAARTVLGKFEPVPIFPRQQRRATVARSRGVMQHHREIRNYGKSELAPQRSGVTLEPAFRS